MGCFISAYPEDEQSIHLASHCGEDSGVAMSGLELLGIAVVVALAAGVQSISGFGFALLSVPLMTLFVEPHIAVVVSTALGIVSTSYQAVRDRADADTVMAKRLILASSCGMPFGLVAFVDLSQDVLRAVLGVVILAVTIVLGKGFTLKRESVHHEWIIGIVSGVLATSLSTNGPPLAFLMHARKIEPDRFRATINRVFAVVGIASFVLFCLAGEVTGDALRASVIVLPTLVLALKVGLILRPRVNAKGFRVLVLVLMAMSGISAIAGAVF